jgi:hypothetical protein
MNRTSLPWSISYSIKKGGPFFPGLRTRNLLFEPLHFFSPIHFSPLTIPYQYLYYPVEDKKETLQNIFALTHV